MNIMVDNEFYETCPHCGSDEISLCERKFLFFTTWFRKITDTILLETVKCDKCNFSWDDHYPFMNSHRGDWLFASPIIKCPVCGGDNFEIEETGRGSKNGQMLSFRCIEDDNFVWTEVYSYSHTIIPKENV